MKNLILTIVSMVSSFALAGGASGGGGGPLGSTVEEATMVLEQYLFFVALKPWNEVTARLEGQSIFTIDNERVKKIYTDILNLNEFNPSQNSGTTYKSLDEFFQAFKSVNKTNKILRVRATMGDCYDVDNKTPAAANYIKGTRNPIQVCMSIPRLKVFSTEQLKEELLNIIVHELAHAAGYKERDARLAQKYFRETIATPCVFKVGRFLEFDYGSSYHMSHHDILKVSLVDDSGPWGELTASWRNEEKDVMGHIDWNGKSHISFKYMGFDKQARYGFVKFEARKYQGQQYHAVTDSYVVVDGKKVEFPPDVRLVDISRGCGEAGALNRTH